MGYWQGMAQAKLNQDRDDKRSVAGCDLVDIWWSVGETHGDPYACDSEVCTCQETGEIMCELTRPCKSNYYHKSSNM